jgi:uncharacterized protein
MQLSKPKKSKSWLINLSALILVCGCAVITYGNEHPATGAQEIRWLTQLANDGDSGAQLQLGLAYQKGRYGVQPDSKRAEQWLDKAAQNGNAYAADLVANHLAEGKPQQMKKAAAYWTRAAQHDNADAQQHLAEYLLQQGDTSHALSWFRKAADLGNPRAKQDLVSLYPGGKLTEDDLHRGENKLAVLGREFHSTGIKSFFALWHLIKASSVYEQSTEVLMAKAKQGDPVAEFQLAVRYRDGAWDVNPDQQKSITWLKRSAAAGNRVAMHDLAKIQQQTTQRDSQQHHAAYSGENT